MKAKEVEIGLRVFIRDSFPLCGGSRVNDVNQLNGVIIGKAEPDDPNDYHSALKPLVKLDSGHVKRVPLHKLEAKKPPVPWKKSTTD